MKNLQVLIVDDEPLIVKELGNYLKLCGFDVHEAPAPSEAFAVLERVAIDLVLLDVRLPEMDGIEVLRRVKERSPGLEVLMMSGHGDMEIVTQALRGGAFDFFRKPLNGDEILAAIERTRRFVALKEELRAVKERYAPLSEEVEKKVGHIIGAGAKIRAVIDLTLKAARAPDTSVLIQGESGTGKELIARVIHFASPRASGPFYTVNCSALPEHLVESEFFGHRKGSFTGAVEDRAGSFENASGGTLFLDEVGDLALAAQSKLLRALETRLVRRIGASRDTAVDVRVVCATHRDLGAMVKSGAFREDLYYRLATFQVVVPPLRERREDLAALIGHYAGLFSEKMGRPGVVVDPSVVASLASYPFPGNIRELKNLVERAVILSEGGPLLPEHFGHPLAVPADDGELASLIEGPSKLADQERQAIIEALRAHDFNRTKASQALGITIYTLIRRMKKHGITPQVTGS
ncbi:MAG: sigma-54-dependent Fis family transcriptional regulator [Spirochaetes bacterium]|nr:sigma-54-dependent Fis family transcriptional regulator [Spirochaetota bacterium]